MINRAVVVGRLTRDPEMRRIGSGNAVVNFTVAVDRGFSSQDGQSADFVPVVAWNKLAENIGQYCSKGSLVAVEGRIRTRSYDNNQGQRVFVVEVQADTVQFLETRAQRERPVEPVQNDDFYDMKTVDIEKDFDDAVNAFDIMEDDIQF